MKSSELITQVNENCGSWLYFLEINIWRTIVHFLLLWYSLFWVFCLSNRKTDSMECALFVICSRCAPLSFDTFNSKIFMCLNSEPTWNSHHFSISSSSPLLFLPSQPLWCQRLTSGFRFFSWINCSIYDLYFNFCSCIFIIFHFLAVSFERLSVINS